MTRLGTARLPPGRLLWVGSDRERAGDGRSGFHAAA